MRKEIKFIKEQAIKNPCRLIINQLKGLLDLSVKYGFQDQVKQELKQSHGWLFK